MVIPIVDMIMSLMESNRRNQRTLHNTGYTEENIRNKNR